MRQFNLDLDIAKPSLNTITVGKNETFDIGLRIFNNGTRVTNVMSSAGTNKITIPNTVYAITLKRQTRGNCDLLGRFPIRAETSDTKEYTIQVVLLAGIGVFPKYYFKLKVVRIDEDVSFSNQLSAVQNDISIAEEPSDYGMITKLHIGTNVVKEIITTTSDKINIQRSGSKVIINQLGGGIDVIPIQYDHTIQSLYIDISNKSEDSVIAVKLTQDGADFDHIKTGDNTFVKYSDNLYPGLYYISTKEPSSVGLGAMNGSGEMYMFEEEEEE